MGFEPLKAGYWKGFSMIGQMQMDVIMEFRDCTESNFGPNISCRKMRVSRNELKIRFTNPSDYIGHLSDVLSSDVVRSEVTISINESSIQSSGDEMDF